MASSSDTLESSAPVRRRVAAPQKTTRPGVSPTVRERAPIVLPARRSNHSGVAVKLLLVGAMAVAMLAIAQEQRSSPADLGPDAEPPALIVETD